MREEETGVRDERGERQVEAEGPMLVATGQSPAGAGRDVPPGDALILSPGGRVIAGRAEALSDATNAATASVPRRDRGRNITRSPAVTPRIRARESLL